MTKEEIYNALHNIDVIAEIEKKDGFWFIENSFDEYHSRATSYHKTLKEAVDALMESSDWFCPKGTGTIVFQEYGLNGKRITIYSGGWENEFGKLWI